MTVYERNQFDYAFYIPPQQKKMGFHFTSNVIKQYYTSNNEYANDILQSALITGILLLAVI
ncbi:MAG: hypothetical protein M9911_15655, partial [Saprospiraceae bacterium]|nr:hypothetical protein [Saprospiraceae bacterium]